MNDPMPAIRSILGMPETETDIEELLRKAKHALNPENALVFVQAAQVRAIQEQTEQLSIANKLAYIALFPHYPTSHTFRAEVEAAL